MILNRVVGPAGQHPRHIGPLLPQGGMRQKQHPLLMVGPLRLDNGRIEMVMPSLPTLLAQSARNTPRQERPPLSPVFIHQPLQETVLLLAPGFLLDSGVGLLALL